MAMFYVIHSFTFQEAQELSSHITLISDRSRQAQEVLPGYPDKHRKFHLVTQQPFRFPVQMFAG